VGVSAPIHPPTARPVPVAKLTDWRGRFAKKGEHELTAPGATPAREGSPARRVP